MNDELTTQTSPAPIVLKLKKFDEHLHPNVMLPHPSHLSLETLDDSVLRSTESSTMNTGTSPSSLRVKFKKAFLNGNTDHSDEEHPNSSTSDLLARPAKRCKKSSSNDNSSHIISVSDIPNDQMSSQEEREKPGNDVKQEHGMISEPSPSSPLVLKIRRDSLTTSPIGVSSAGETDSNRQLLLKLKKNEHGELISQNPPSDTSMLAEQAATPTPPPTVQSNGHHHHLPLPNSPPITNMLANLPSSPTTHPISQVPVVSTVLTATQTAETHTKELLDEALDSVKNVLMQTFKKNLESGGDLNDLKSTLGSDEVAEVFLAKLRQSLKRDSNAIAENESKAAEVPMETDLPRCETPNTLMSPVMNVVSSPSSSSPLLPSLSSMLAKSTSPSITLPSSPQSQTTPTNNKRKSSTPSTNPNRFDGVTEEEVAKRLLIDILQPNLDIVFVGINPSLYAVHKGHHYGGPGNHFWKLLHMSALIPTAFNANEDYRMPQYGIGFTNIVQRPTKAGSDITKDEITAGAEVLMQKIKMFRPKIVAFNGRGIYEVYAGNKHFHYGKQPELFPGTDTHVFVMPSSSARCSQLPRAEDKLPFYVGLRKLRDFVNGTLQSLNEAEITFPDIKIKDTDDVLQKTIIRISNKPFSELSAETLKPYGDKIPSGQMISKHIPSSSQQILCSSPSPSSSSSSNLVFNTEALTTQTMSILHQTTTPEQNNNHLLTYDQQAQRVYLQNNGNYAPSPPTTPSTPVNNPQPRSISNGLVSSKGSFLENSPTNTNAAVLAALASGGHNPTSQTQSTFYQPIQTVFVGGQTQALSCGPTVLNARSSVITTTGGISSPTSNVIHYPPTESSSSPSPVVPRQLVMVNSSEPLPSFDTILHPSPSHVRSQPNPSSKDLHSSQPPASKPTLILVPPTIKQLASNSSGNLILPKLSNQTKASVEKRSTDDCLFVRYEREPASTTADPFRFSFVIDEHSPALHKRLRYVSINDL